MNNATTSREQSVFEIQAKQRNRKDQEMPTNNILRLTRPVRYDRLLQCGKVDYWDSVLGVIPIRKWTQIQRPSFTRVMDDEEDRHMEIEERCIEKLFGEIMG